MKKTLMLSLLASIALCSCNYTEYTNVANVEENLTSAETSISTFVTTLDTSSVPVSYTPAVTSTTSVQTTKEVISTTSTTTNSTTTVPITTPIEEITNFETTTQTSEESEEIETEVIVREPIVLQDLYELNGTITKNVNFRSSPEYGENIITTFPSKKKVTILNLEDNDEFVKVRTEDTVGYVNRNYIKVEKLNVVCLNETEIIIDEDVKKVLPNTRISLINTPNGYVLATTLKSVEINFEDFINEKKYKSYIQNNAEKELVTSFETFYSLESQYEGKAYNINLCCSEISTVILNGEDFNWHIVVGDTTDKEGYVLANTFSGGKVVKGYGGGVCQVASTLYNCALNLDMKVKEVHHHGLEVKYVDWRNGKDATVGDIGQQNLIFENNLGYDLIIVAYTSTVEENPIDQRGKLTIEFYKVK